MDSRVAYFSADYLKNINSSNLDKINHIISNYKLNIEPQVVQDVLANIISNTVLNYVDFKSFIGEKFHFEMSNLDDPINTKNPFADFYELLAMYLNGIIAVCPHMFTAMILALGDNGMNINDLFSIMDPCDGIPQCASSDDAKIYIKLQKYHEFDMKNIPTY